MQTRPLRLITLQCSHIGFTDGRTFIRLVLLLTESWAPRETAFAKAGPAKIRNLDF